MPIQLSGSGSITGVSTFSGPITSLDVSGNVSVGGTLSYEDVTSIDSVGVITARSGLHVTSGNLHVTSGNVAIGHNNPLNTLHVKGPTGGVSARFTDAVNATVFVSHPSSGKSKIADAGGNYGFEFDTASVNILSGGSERLRIDSAGAILVGEISSSQGRFSFHNAGSSGGDAASTNNMGLSVRNDAGPSIVDLTGIDNFTARIHNGAYAGSGISDPQGTITKLLFHGVTHNGWNAHSAICMDVQGTSGSKGDLVFLTGGNGSDLNERLRIDSSGNLTAVNTSSGGATTLKVGANATSGVNSGTVIINNGGTGDGALQFDYENSAARAKIYVYRSTQDLIFDTAGSERLRILSDGTITTGGLSSTPGTVAAGSFVQAAANAGFFSNGIDGKFGTASSHPLYFQTNGITKATITAAGAFSVGTTSPQQPNLASIHLHSTANDDARIAITTPSKPDSRIGYFGLSNKFGVDVHNGFEVRDASASYATRLTITSTGQVGLGFDSPTSALHGRVTSGGYNAIFESTANGGESVVTLKGKKSDGTVRTAVFKYDNADMIRLGTSQSIPMRFETSDTERLRITSDGKIGINASSGWNAYGDILLVQGNIGATAKSMISVRGGSTGYVHSALKLSATTHSNSSGNQRGLGVFMHDETSNVEWYAGRPYATSDYFVVARNTGVNNANAGGVTAQRSMRKWEVDSSGRTVQTGAIHTYQPGIGGGKTTRAFEAKGGAGTYSTCQIDVSQHSYGSVAWDIKVGGYHSAHQHVAGTYYCNGNLFANYTSINNSGPNVSYTRAFTSNQTIRHTFTYNNGFVHPICEVTATCGGDGYLGPGDITITWS